MPPISAEKIYVRIVKCGVILLKIETVTYVFYVAK